MHWSSQQWPSVGLPGGVHFRVCHFFSLSVVLKRKGWFPWMHWCLQQWPFSWTAWWSAPNTTRLPLPCSNCLQERYPASAPVPFWPPNPKWWPAPDIPSHSPPSSSQPPCLCRVAVRHWLWVQQGVVGRWKERYPCSLYCPLRLWGLLLHWILVSTAANNSGSGVSA